MILKAAYSGIYWRRLAKISILVAALAGAGGPSPAHAQGEPLSHRSSGAVAAPLGAAEESGSTIEGLGETPAADKTARDAPSMSDSKDRNDKFQLGGSYIGVQTEKTVRVIDPTKSTDCANDDDCMDYSGLPKSVPARHGLKSFRKPFLGLSITRPWSW
jgi:hypothetical protein